MKLNYAFPIVAFRPWWKFWQRHTIVSHRFDEDFFWTGISANILCPVYADIYFGKRWRGLRKFLSSPLTLLMHLVLKEYREVTPIFSGWQFSKGAEISIDFRWLGSPRAAQIVFYGTVTRLESGDAGFIGPLPAAERSPKSLT